MSSVFGPAVFGSTIEQAAVSTLQLWLPTYLAELERDTSRAAGVLAPPRSWSTAAAFYQQQGSQIPAGIVISPGTVDQPQRMGDGTYAAWWRLEVAVLVTAKDQVSANELAKLYARAVTMILLQKPSLGGVASQVEWEGEQYTDAPANFTPVGAVGGTAVNVRVDGVVTSAGGPAAPTLSPDVYTQVATAEIAVERNT